MIKSIILYITIHLFRIFSHKLTSNLYHILLSHPTLSSNINYPIYSAQEISSEATSSKMHANDLSISTQINTHENLYDGDQYNSTTHNIQAKNQDNYNELSGTQ